jgi:hypothetical protein
MNAVERILAYDDGQINQHRDATWQQRRDNSFKGKQKPDNSLPEGTFKQESPGGIANTLKTKSKDYDQAMRRLNNYTNGRGREMPNTERRKLDDAKESLRDAFGKPNTDDSTTTQPTTAIFQQSFNAVPGGHNLDDSRLDTGIDSKPEDNPKSEIGDPIMSGAVARLCGE